MKLNDILLTESMTFSPVDLIIATINGKEIKRFTPRTKEMEEECRECEYTREYLEDSPDINTKAELELAFAEAQKSCRYCNGTGKTIEHITTTPELNLSNSNAVFLLRMLKIDTDGDDYCGVIYNKDLAAVKQKLLRWKNSKDLGVKPPEITGGNRVVRKDPQTGMDTIGRGATMYDQGRSEEYINSLINRFYVLIDYAQKNDMHVSWG